MASQDYSLFSWKRNEIVFVGIVLTLLFSVSWVQLKVGQMKTRDAQRKADVELVARALTDYYDDYGQYPLATGSGQIVSCEEAGGAACVWGEGRIVDGDNVAYLNQVPVDPLAHQGRTYVYSASDNRQQFIIYVALEYSRDPAWKKDLTTWCGNNVQCNWYVEN